MLTALLAIALLTPTAHAETTVAYLTPEEVLLQEQYDYYLPPNPRRVRQIAEEQEAQRNAQYGQSSTAGAASSQAAAPQPTTPPPVLSNPIAPHPSAPASGENVAPLDDTDPYPDPEDTTTDPGMDSVTLRLIERLQRAQYQPQMPAPTGETVQPTRHREDLVGSGPASLLMMLVIIGAVGYTLLRASGRRARMIR